jgi:hypothetical protein
MGQTDENKPHKEGENPQIPPSLIDGQGQNAERHQTNSDNTTQQPQVFPKFRRKRCNSPEWFLVYVTFGLVVITGMLAFYTWGLFREATGQSHSVDSSLALTKRSVGVAESSLAVSKKNVDLYWTAVKIETRAYVSIAPPEIHFDKIVGHKFEVIWDEQNTGKTPAYKVFGDHHIGVLAESDYKNSINNEKMIWRGYGFVYGQGIPLPQKIQIANINQMQTDSLSAGVWHIFFWGTITYEDKFGERHFTQWGMNYGWDVGSMRVTREHNNAN